MKTLILAAGEGNRFGELTKQKPKALLQIAGMPLLGRILRGIKEAGIQDVWIVVGYKADLIRKEFGEKYDGLNIRYVHARNWEKGNLHSFLAARGFTDANFLLCMCDHIFEVDIVKKLLSINSESALVLATDKKGYADDDTRVLEHNGLILDTGKFIKSSNCVDTGFFLCSPKMFKYAEEAARKGMSELADSVRIAAMNKDAQVIDVSGHYWADIDSRQDLERGKWLLVKNAQKKRGASDFVAHYFNCPIENAIIQRIAGSWVTPNKLTIATNVLAYIVTALFFTGHLLIGSVLTFIVGIMDGLDGKLARVRGQTTQLGRMEHAFDLLFEFSWLVALGLFLSRTEGLLPLILMALSVTFISFYRFCYDQFSRATGVSLDVYGGFERAFRRIAGRRNIYNVYILIGVLLRMPLYSLIGILFHSALTAIVYAYRAAIHMHAIDKKEQHS